MSSFAKTSGKNSVFEKKRTAEIVETNLRPNSVSVDAPPMGVNRPVIGNLSSLLSSCSIISDQKSEKKKTEKNKYDPTIEWRREKNAYASYSFE